MQIEISMENATTNGLTPGDFVCAVLGHSTTRTTGSRPSMAPGKAEIMNEPIVAKILVVDDVELNRDALSRRLIRSGHSVKTAEDGEIALRMLNEEPFDLVLLDVMMPGLSGLQVLTKIRETKSADVLPVIMATAKTTSEDIVAALELGANDYVTKPLDFPIVRARIQAQLKLKRASENLAVANTHMKKGLNAAAKIQQAGLPRPVDVPGYQFAWKLLPCDELAGDGLNIMPFDERNVVVCAWDVSGHGVPAALLSVSVSYMLNPGFGKSSIMMTNGWVSQRLSTPAEVATRLNDAFQLVENLNENLDEAESNFVTLCYGVLDSTTGIFKYTSAGHPHPIHVRDGKILNTAQLNGTPIGVLPSEDCEYEEAEIELLHGDRLFLFSDGVEEAVNSKDESFGISAIYDACQQSEGHSLEESLEVLIQRLADWHGSKHFDDDVSMIAIERL